MKIAIDCRSLRKPPTGVPNFLISVINTLVAEKKDWQFYLLTNEDFHPDAKKRIRPSDNLFKIVEPLIIFPRIATLWYLVKLFLIVRRLKVDFFYTPIPNLPFFIPKLTNTIITVHDVVYKRYPQTMSRGNWLINFFLHDRSIMTADKIWAISGYTKSEVEVLYPKRKCQDIFTGTAVEKSLFKYQDYDDTVLQSIKNKYGIRERYILTVGTIEPRKNLKFLLALMPKLSQHGMKLIVVGARGWGDFKAPWQEEQQNEVKFADFISIEELITLYHFAAVYVSTSLNEGFCLPLLEAMSCGCPVVAANNSAMTEVARDAGETVDGWDENAWVETILKVSRNRDHYKEMGLLKATRYDWKQIAKNVTAYISN